MPNGLEVVAIENSKVPLATIEIAVKNGAYTEGPEYSGLSHLFEHMFFKANKDYPTPGKIIKKNTGIRRYMEWHYGCGKSELFFYF